MQPSQPAAGSPLKERFVFGRPNFPRRSVIVATLAVTLTAAPVSLVLGDTLNVPGDFPSIQAAHDAATSGDTILVAPGTYVGSLTISKAITLGSHFITTGDPSFITSTILDGGNGSFVITIPSSAGDRPTIQGLTIQNAGDGISPNAKFNLLNNVIRDTSDGVDYEDGSGGLAQFNIFEQNGDDGIDLDNDVDIVIADNIIRNNGDDGIEIRMQSYNGPTLNIIIERNVIHDNGEDGIQLIHYDVLTDRFIEIRNNTIYNSNDVGIGMMDGSNTSEDFRAASIPERINIFNNTFRNNRYGITGGDNTVVVNNIFVDHPVIAVKNVDGNSALAFNLFFNNGTDNSGSNVDEGSSLFVDPVLDSNLALLPGSPAIDSGTASYVWQGMTVLDLPASAYSGAAPDIGAFELESGNGPPPDPPILLLPLDGASNVGLTPTLQWSGEGTQFTVQIATDAGFVSPVDVASVSVTQYTVTQGTLEHLATYFWRVDASDANGTSDFSATWSFTTEAAASPPEPPILVAPPNGATSVPVGATLQWAGTADDFDVEVAADSSFTSVVHSANTASSSMTLPASALAHETQYYWHVRGNNAFGVGSFSPTSSFTTVAPPDTIPPSKPQNLSSPDQTGTTIDLVWDPSTDNVGVSFYRIYRDNVLVASESSAQHTAVGLTPGTPYDFEVSAVDDAGLESQRSDTLTVTTLDFSDPVTVAIRVGSGSDDAEERDSGGMRMTSSDLELVYDGGIQTVGMRFNGVGIPQGAWIVHATIQFQVDEVSVGATSLAIQGEDIDHAPTFANVSGNISSRARTSASVPWIPAPWPTVGQAGPDQQTPDIASVIQEIVNRPSWAAGNSLVIIITGNGERGAESFDGVPSAAPLLIVEYAEGGPPGNTPPTVDAGLPQAITLPATASLDGTVTDDGVPDPPGSVTTSWSELSGPGTVSFSDSSAVDTTVSFSEAGTYVLRLTADDGALSAFADVTVTVEPEPVINEPPSVSAGVPQTITLPATASLDGTVTDDGVPDPPGSVTTSWSELSGPGTVSFSDSSAVDTTASFSEAGTYVLRLTADDGALSAFADVTVTVDPEPAVNEPPSVNAGVAQTITLPATASLDGTVTDDGVPDPPGSVTTSWSELSGPGTVSFADSSAVDTSASFSEAGTYVLRLTADDGALSAFADVTVTVEPEFSTGPVEVRIADSSDDAEESAGNGNVRLTGRDIHLGFNNKREQTVGLRFNGVNIPPGAVISHAYIQFQAFGTEADPASITIQGEDTDAALTFENISQNISSRIRTTELVGWSPLPWTNGDAGPDQRTPDIASIIQEIVDRPGWLMGNSLAIIITGTGERVAVSYNQDPSAAPLLHVEFSVSP